MTQTDKERIEAEIAKLNEGNNQLSRAVVAVVRAIARVVSGDNIPVFVSGLRAAVVMIESTIANLSEPQ